MIWNDSKHLNEGGGGEPFLYEPGSAMDGDLMSIRSPRDDDADDDDAHHARTPPGGLCERGPEEHVGNPADGQRAGGVWLLRWSPAFVSKGVRVMAVTLWFLSSESEREKPSQASPNPP